MLWWLPGHLLKGSPRRTLELPVRSMSQTRREPYEVVSAPDRTFSLNQVGLQIPLLFPIKKKKKEKKAKHLRSNGFLAATLAFLISPPARSSDLQHGPCWASMKWKLFFQKSMCQGGIQPSSYGLSIFSFFFFCSGTYCREQAWTEESKRKGVPEVKPV